MILPSDKDTTLTPLLFESYLKYLYIPSTMFTNETTKQIFFLIKTSRKKQKSVFFSSVQNVYII